MFEHPSGVAGAFDRTSHRPNDARLIFVEDNFAHAAELNELQSVIERRARRVGNLVSRDGDRAAGADIVVDQTAGTVFLSTGRIYVAGDVREVPEATFTGVLMAGEITVGVRLIREVIRPADDASLLGLQPGTPGEGEEGAARETERLAWTINGSGSDGDYYTVYTLRDGAVIDQSPPPALSGIVSKLAEYDRDAMGNYIVDGCVVQALGKDVASQMFSISAGTANIQGYKRIREAALRHAQVEDPDLELIAAEPHTFTGTTGGSAIVEVSRPPIAQVTQAVVSRRATVTVTRGVVPGGSDALQHAAVVEIESVKQGATTYVSGVDYALAGDRVSWAPAGAEPAASSTFTVVYIYNEAVTPTLVTDTAITVTGGVQGKPVLLSYSSKIPRIDLLCLDITGRPAYLKGISARKNALPPIAPEALLKLAEIHNSWIGVPTVINNGNNNFKVDQQARYFGLLIRMLEQFGRSEAERDIQGREGVSKRGIFVDAFTDDFFRDQGLAQTAATNRGVLQLAIDNVLVQRMGDGIETLPWVEEIVVRQDMRTSSMKINPYDNFEVMPGEMVLEPPVDFWTEQQTTWTSPITREFSAAPGQPPGQDTINEVTEIRRATATTLRQIPIVVTVRGFAASERLATLTMDGVSIKPAGIQSANASGVLTINAVIPPNMPVGRRLIRADGQGGSYAEAIFAGEGVIDVTTMRRVTLVAQAAPVPIIVNNTTIINNITEVIQPALPVVFPILAGIDPLAQTFSLVEGRAIVGLNFRFTAIGNRNKGVRVQLAEAANGQPTNIVLAEAFVPMQSVQAGDLVRARFRAPVWCPAGRQFCFVLMTSDGAHAVAIARLGDVDPITQQRVSAQPYTIGVLLSSANRLTWTAHQDADLHMEIVAADFTAVARTIDLWTGQLQQVSDVLIRGTFELPTAEARARYEMVRASGAVVSLAPDQTWESDQFVTEQVTIRAVLTGSRRVSPVLYPASTLIGGRIRTSGTYATKMIPMGAAVTVKALFAASLPAGSAVSVEVDNGAGVWSAMTPASGAQALGGGWIEPVYERTSHAAAEGRVRVTMSGGPAARPALARLKAYSF